MRTSSLALVVLAGFAWMSSGCGTVANFVSLKPKVYGGTERDLYFFRKYWPSPSGAGSSGGGPSDPRGALLFLALFLGIPLTELGCTALGDTLTLPITMQLDPEWPPPKQPESQSDYSACPVQYSTSQAREVNEEPIAPYKEPEPGSLPDPLLGPTIAAWVKAYLEQALPPMPGPISPPIPDPPEVAADNRHP
jgi:hypothetical protein